MNYPRTLDTLFDLDADSRIIACIAMLSAGLGLLATAYNASMVNTAALVLLPWLFVLARKIHGDWKRFGVLAIFELLVLFQLAHFAEHVAQIVEIHGLDWVTSKGIIGELDIEPVHFWWNTLILTATAALLLHYRRNTWLWASFAFSIWHELEHVYIYFVWYIGKGVSGHPGILGAGGIVDQANLMLPILTDLSRPDLHFWYNLFEIGLFAIAFVVQAQSVMRAAHIAPSAAWQLAPRTRASAPERSGVGWRRWKAVLLPTIQVPLILILALLLHSPPTLRVPEDYAAIQDAINFAPGGAIIRIAPGTYNEVLLIRKPLTLVGSDGGAVRIGTDHTDGAIITIRDTRNVTLRNLNVVNGNYGILVEESQNVALLNNRVSYAWFAGIRLSRASAQIVGNEVRSTLGAYGMGIELANTVSRPPSLIRGNLIEGNSQEGIVLHNAHASIELNRVLSNGLRGISINEMSEATVRGNTLDGNADASIYVVDSSMADIFGNRITNVRRGPLGDAHGIRADFHAEVMLGQNDIDCPPADAVVARSGAVISRP